MRECGGVELIIEYMADAVPQVVQRALVVMGNLASDAVDPKSSLTKQVCTLHRCIITRMRHTEHDATSLSVT